MRKLTDWRKAVLLPVISGETNKDWDLDALETVIQESMQDCAIECMNGNIPIGDIVTTLSGGLDSSLALAMLRKTFGSQATIHTFTIAGRNDHPDLIYARNVAELFHTKHHEWVVPQELIRPTEARIQILWPDDPIEAGDVAVFLLYENIANYGFESVIAYDVIDELTGGYWGHLEKHHLLPLERKAQHFDIEVLFPYCQEEVIKYISQIPLDDRTSLEMSKIPLRRIAEKYLPAEIIMRDKIGFCDALNSQ